MALGQKTESPAFEHLNLEGYTEKVRGAMIEVKVVRENLPGKEHFLGRGTEDRSEERGEVIRRAQATCAKAGHSDSDPGFLGLLGSEQCF